VLTGPCLLEVSSVIGRAGVSDQVRAAAARARALPVEDVSAALLHSQRVQRPECASFASGHEDVGGSNENGLLLHQYFPKKTDLSLRGRERVLAVVDELNQGPRQTEARMAATPS
jgi:hypothetical protein